MASFRDDLVTRPDWSKALDASDQHACDCVSTFLQAGPASVLPGLRQLDEQLALRVHNNERHKMRSVLTQSEVDWGVNVDANDSVQVTALRMLMPDEFGAQLASQRLIKDPGAGSDHGEYTHRIQWYVLNKCKVLSAGAANRLLRLSGAPIFLAERGNANGLWDCLFDRLRKKNGNMKIWLAESETDFRSPEHFNLWMLRQGDQLPTLASFLFRRFARLLDAERIDDATLVSLYASAPRIAAHLDTLQGADKERLQGLWKENAFALIRGVIYVLKKQRLTITGCSAERLTAACADYARGSYQQSAMRKALPQYPRAGSVSHSAKRLLPIPNVRA